MTDGIHIPREIADTEGVPEDLDANVVGPYRFPDPRRRRIAGWIYAILGLALAIGGLARPGWLVVALVAGGLAAWHFLSAWPLEIDQEEALTRAAAAVSFPVGHASAAVTFHGFRSRPHWHVVVYSAEEPPTERALVQLDAITGERVDEVYVEPVPEG